ncbi:hypothetical protein E4U21_002078, partial [Claviceps maximensis]
MGKHHLYPRNPVPHHGLDQITVLLHEKHVPVAVDTRGPELEMRRPPAPRLPEEGHGAVVVRGVVSRLGRHHQYVPVRKVDQTARPAPSDPLGLQHTVIEMKTRPRRRPDLALQIHGRIRHGRLVHHRD